MAPLRHLFAFPLLIASSCLATEPSELAAQPKDLALVQETVANELEGMMLEQIQQEVDAQGPFTDMFKQIIKDMFKTLLEQARPQFRNVCSKIVDAVSTRTMSLSDGEGEESSESGVASEDGLEGLFIQQHEAVLHAHEGFADPGKSFKQRLAQKAAAGAKTAKRFGSAAKTALVSGLKKGASAAVKAASALKNTLLPAIKSLIQKAAPILKELAVKAVPFLAGKLSEMVSESCQSAEDTFFADVDGGAQPSSSDASSMDDVL